MKNKFIFALAAALVLAGCSKPNGDKLADAPNQTSDAPKTRVTLDAETQERIGLKMENPAAAQWQPVIHAIGNVVDPLALTAAAADYETARAAAVASQNELERTQKLAEENNVSPKALETVQAAAARDALALKSAQAKFTAGWGVQLAAQTNLAAVGDNLQNDDCALVKLTLPVGTYPKPLPNRATIFLFESETNIVTGDFADDLKIDPATQIETLLFSVKQKLPPGLSVTAQLKVAGEPENGVTVPDAAIVRHDGQGWVYVQMETNRFQRVEVPLDRQTENGWFVSESLSATNRIVTGGAQTVLSAELSSGGFNTGQRD
jgi:hypothetical protein